MMNAEAIKKQLETLGLRAANSSTLPGTFSWNTKNQSHLISLASLTADQTDNRDSASWKKAEWVILEAPFSADNKEAILNGWRSMTGRDAADNTPRKTKIQKLCVPTDTTLTRFDVYDASSTLIKSGELNEIIGGHTLLPPAQIAYYGVPGSGKSFTVNNEINEKLKGVPDPEYHKIRCVFHPEYSNADFVGQVFPCIVEGTGKDGEPEEHVEYRFRPGPFAKIVRRAYLNPNEPFFLIIEEINRGNAAAIFGEAFQLLDRIKPEDNPEEVNGNTYGEGWSSYGVDNLDLNAYIRDKNAEIPDAKPQIEKSTKVAGTLEFNANSAIRLPPNLSIYATMNTSDQNVFAMDNAFQRRFESEMIPNGKTDENADQYDIQCNLTIERTNVTWGEFRGWINKEILAVPGLSKAEDKQLGAWFITKDPDSDGISRKRFAEKVLKYLWNDVFKRRSASSVFKLDSFAATITAFEKKDDKNPFDAILTPDAKTALDKFKEDTNT